MFDTSTHSYIMVACICRRSIGNCYPPRPLRELLLRLVLPEERELELRELELRALELLRLDELRGEL